MNPENLNNPYNSESNQFGLPNGYFQKSAGNILNKIDWEEEHKTFPRLLSLKKHHGFSVPENYFRINEGKLELSPFATLKTITKSNQFSVPEHYFDECELNELAKIITIEQEEIPPFSNLNAIKKQNNFKVDASYFANTEKKIQKQLSAGKVSGKIINLFSLKIFYAIAALLVVALGLWTYNSFYKIADVKDCGTLACVDKSEILKEKNFESIEDEDLYDVVDSKKLEQNLEQNNSKSTESDSSLKNAATEDVLDAL